MGYILNDEQKNVVDLARDFAQKEVAPKVKEYARRAVSKGI